MSVITYFLEFAQQHLENIDEHLGTIEFKSKEYAREHLCEIGKEGRMKIQWTITGISDENRMTICIQSFEIQRNINDHQ